MLITEEHILQGRGINGGWTQEQLSLLNVPSLTDNWKSSVVGIRNISEEALNEFLSLRSNVRIRVSEWSDKAPATSAVEKMWLNVPFKDKEKAKAIGARWNPAEKKWYVSADAATGVPKQWFVRLH